MGGKTHCMNGQIKGNAVHSEMIASRGRHVKRDLETICQRGFTATAATSPALMQGFAGDILRIMKLSEWLSANKLTQAEFAVRLSVHRSTICKIVNGDRVPSVRMAQNIYKMTHGHVNLLDWTDHEQEKSQGRSVERIDG
jgi:DNA-binding XRE family transcriptional regulator